MITSFIVVLAVCTVYFGMKWLDARAEVAELQAAVAVLKRRLKRGAG